MDVREHYDDEGDDGGFDESEENELEAFDNLDAEGTEEKTSSIRPELKKLYNQHPELIIDYVESVLPQVQSVENRKTYPFITHYEKTKIIGLRANQLSKGAKPYISLSGKEYITNVRDIARMELEQKRLPFIIKRPLPNGKYEYLRISDLIIL